jgi:hypothetical protein
MHPKIMELATQYGVVFSDRDATGDYLYDGKTIAIRNQRGMFLDHDLLHEVVHFIIAAPEQKDLPEYGLGTSASNQCSLETPNVVDNDMLGEEASIQESMVQFMCIKWGMQYSISPKLQEGYDAPSWHHYWELKEMESQFCTYQCGGDIRFDGVKRRWLALFRLHQLGLL